MQEESQLWHKQKSRKVQELLGSMESLSKIISEILFIEFKH